MAGRKRTSEDAGVTTRGNAKSARTKDGDTSPAKEAKESPKSKGKKNGGPKATLTSEEFKARALPLHMNVTHTPPALSEDKDTKPAAEADPGFIGTTALTPAVFSTGSYGWKGSKRITIEVEDPESGKKEKVQVMLSINATVMGSKPPAKGKKGGKAAEEEEEEEEEAGDEEE